MQEDTQKFKYITSVGKGRSHSFLRETLFPLLASGNMDIFSREDLIAIALQIHCQRCSRGRLEYILFDENNRRYDFNTINLDSIKGFRKLTLKNNIEVFKKVKNSKITPVFSTYNPLEDSKDILALCIDIRSLIMTNPRWYESLPTENRKIIIGKAVCTILTLKKQDLTYSASPDRALKMASIVSNKDALKYYKSFMISLNNLVQSV